MNIDLLNTIYTAKFTDKSALAYILPAKTCFEDSKEPPKAKAVKYTHKQYSSAVRKQTSKTPFPLHAFILLVRRFVIFSNLECCQVMSGNSPD